MNLDRYTDRLLCLLEGRLDPKDKALLHAEIEASPELQEELHRLQEMRGLLQDTVKMSSDSVLNPFFTDRLMRRLEPANIKQFEQDDIAFFLSRLFRPVALAGLVVAMFLAVYNVNISGSYTSQTTTAEAILALPPVNTLAVYDLDLYVEDDPGTTSTIP